MTCVPKEEIPYSGGNLPQTELIPISYLPPH